ncbi:glycine cleavage system aminomethyltransferase GcvT [Thermanaeromonas sp. C210]|uniref:glycine cleavage system aminomethyltransferase GcvT n=1 Tax=Thermanaeromonas sp. C210 TaxID=2731925 RepID=UPI00155B562F|nr:glycine cleavage system aminomethyltransferase GcvT [Thermanaeromonas sp. C210]GFN22341.1 aminomethyltransferase [Thermanaeromonas sp. C210]
MSNQEGKRTPLYEEHLAAGARMVEFGGWLMPVQYTGILEEHQAVRTQAGLFDVSHMGEIEIKGPDAFSLIQQLITNDASLARGDRVIYSPMCYPDGGTVDDILVYPQGEDKYLLVVNAANTAKDLEWIQKQAEEGGADAVITDLSSATVQLALQGPEAAAILQPLTDVNLQDLGYYRWTRGRVQGIYCLISRTGYTGEDGFELYLDPAEGPQMWRGLLEAGRDRGLKPCGLGARDVLRLEAALPLYGHELGPHITPVEAGLGRFIRPEKGEFNGREVLKQQKEVGPPRRLVGLVMQDRGIPRPDYPVSRGDKVVGRVTSGSFAPALGKNIALALVEKGYALEGEELTVNIRGREHPAQVVPLPFYSRKKKGVS